LGKYGVRMTVLILCSNNFYICNVCASSLEWFGVMLYSSDDEIARVCDFQTIPTHPDFQAEEVNQCLLIDII